LAPPLRAQQYILGFPLPFFHEWFFAVYREQGEELELSFPFPFPSVVSTLIWLCYLMADHSFDLDLFLVDVDFGGLSSHILLLPVLSYLGESQLRARVPASLAQMEPPAREDIPPVIPLSWGSFDLSGSCPICAQRALQCVYESLAALLYDWSTCDTASKFITRSLGLILLFHFLLRILLFQFQSILLITAKS
jgi:hypothetical protein